MSSNKKTWTNCFSKFWVWLKIQTHISIYDIALAGILISICLVVVRFLVVPIPLLFKFKFEYIFFILFAIMFKPLQSIFVSVITDLLSTLISGQIGMWMWQYAIIPVFITLIAALFNRYIFNQNSKKWFVTIIIIDILIITFMIAALITSLNFNKIFNAKMIWGICFSFIMIFIVSIFVMFFLMSKNSHDLNKFNNIKNIISLTTLISIIVVILMWIWEPYAFMAWQQKNHKILNSEYTEQYLINMGRTVVKSPVAITLYTALIIPIYSLNKLLRKQKLLDRW